MHSLAGRAEPDGGLISRSTHQLCEILETVKQKHLRLIIVGSITVDCRSGSIDPMSQAFVQMAAVFAELELSIIRARVRSGLQNAKEKGRVGGRPRTTTNDIPPIFYKHYPSFTAGKINVSELANDSKYVNETACSVKGCHEFRQKKRVCSPAEI